MVLCLLFLPERGKAGQDGRRGGGMEGMEGRLTPLERKGNGLGVYSLPHPPEPRYRRRLPLVVTGGNITDLSREGGSG